MSADAVYSGTATHPADLPPVKPARRPFRSSAARPRRRQHGQVQQFDRCELERSGWRTTLDYQENHVRGRDGQLEQLHVTWRAEAERTRRDGVVQVVAASGSTPGKAWSRLRAEADLVDVRARRTVDAGFAR